jgi:PAS domain S-box-containing protein
VENKEKTEGQILSELEEPHQELDQGRKSEAQPKQVEKDFQCNQENLRSILRLTSDMVFVIDLDGVFKSYYRSSSEEDLYAPPEEFLGKHYNRVLPTHIAQMLERALNNIKITGQIQQFDYPLDIKGNLLWYNARLSSFKHQPEGTPAILATVRNITERKKAEEALRESEEKYRATVEQSADNIYIMDIETRRVLEANATLQNLLGYTAEEIKKLTIYDFIAHSPKDIDRKIEKLVERKRYFIGERKYRRKDGSLVDVEVSGSFIAYGGRKALSIVTRDITERKRAEEKLRESEERHRMLFETSPDGIVIAALDGKILDANQAYQDMLGYTLTELKCINYLQLTPKKWHQKEQEAVKSFISGKGYGYFEKEYIRKDGTIFPVALTGWLIKDKQGNPEKIGVFVCDITDRRRAEEILKENEEKFRDLFENANDLIQSVNASGEFVYANKKWLETLGYSKEELGRLKLTDILREDQIPHCREIFKKVCNGESFEKVETVFKSKDGSEIVVEGNVNAKIRDGKFIATRGIFRDITEQKKMEAAHRTLVENSLQGLAILEGYKIDFVNPTLAEMLGYTVEELMSFEAKEWEKVIHPEDREFVLKRYADRMQGKKAQSHYEFRMLRKDGTVLWVELFSSRIQYGGKTAIQAAFVDVTDRRCAEEALRESSARLQALINAIPDIIYFKDAEGRNLVVNKAFEKMVGLTYKKIVGKTDEELLPPDLADYCKQSDAKVIKSGQALRSEEQCVDKDGKRVFFETIKAPLHDDKGKVMGLVGVSRDTTERKKMQEELLKAKKLESIGILAGGIAHDFNNILTGILGNISVAKAKVNSEDEIFKTLVKAEKASLRAKDLTQQLLTFSKGGAPIKETTSIGELIEDSANFVLRGSNVKCEFSIPDGLWPVEIDKGQINQVLNNLIINADQSMPDGGVINVSAENVSISAKDTLPLKKGRYIKIIIKDQGIGIPEQHLQKIFDPYFTTKKKGDGLGLATSYSIVKNHKGHIQVESKLGAGSTLIIYLPASRKKITKKKLPEEKPLAGKGRILVMDDEDVVREVVGDLLSILGYEVEFAKDGDEVIGLYKKAVKSGQPFDAVIMDLTVPGGMGGKESIKKLLKIDPEVKAIVSSGYSNDPVMSDFKKYGFRGIVAKPFKMEELSQVLHQVLT